MEGESQWDHLVLWAKKGWIDHWAYPVRRERKPRYHLWDETPEQERERELKEESKEEETTEEVIEEPIENSV